MLLCQVNTDEKEIVEATVSRDNEPHRITKTPSPELNMPQIGVFQTENGETSTPPAVPADVILREPTEEQFRAHLHNSQSNSIPQTLPGHIELARVGAIEGLPRTNIPCPVTIGWQEQGGPEGVEARNLVAEVNRLELENVGLREQLAFRNGTIEACRMAYDSLLRTSQVLEQALQVCNINLSPVALNEVELVSTDSEQRAMTQQELQQRQIKALKAEKAHPQASEGETQDLMTFD